MDFFKLIYQILIGPIRTNCCDCIAHQFYIMCVFGSSLKNQFILLLSLFLLLFMSSTTLLVLFIMVLKTEPDIKPFFFYFRFNPDFCPGFDRFGSLNRTGLVPDWTGRTGRSGLVFKTVISPLILSNSSLSLSLSLSQDNNKQRMNNDCLNKIEYRIDNLMLVFLKSSYAK